MPVHLRLNDKDTSRNPFINFVTALPGPRSDEALRRLQQLAAMAKPLMKDQGFHINSLEEYEWNKEFAGRCWNNGEVIELVLTRANGEWIPLQYVLYVFCHELAHIKHMNHIPHLHGALTRHLKDLALQKQREGYYGDGLWSAGRTVGQGNFVGGLGMHQQQQELPEHVCGGAFGRTRAGRRAAGRRRRGAGARSGTGRKFKGPSLHTGAQTSANTRGGNRRVKIEAATTGTAGSRVDGRNELPTASAKSKDYKQDANSTFRKRTQTRDARELRANAALARFSNLGSGVKGEDEDDKARVVKLESTLPNAFARQSSHSASPGPSRLPVKPEAADDSETESEADDSATEDEDDYEADGDLVGNDLGEAHFTQGHGETAEQRRRRMTRFGDEQEDTDKDTGRLEWADLLDEDGSDKPDRPQVEQTDTGPSKRRKIDDVDKTAHSDEDDVIFVREHSKPPGTAKQSVASVATALQGRTTSAASPVSGAAAVLGHGKTSDVTEHKEASATRPSEAPVQTLSEASPSTIAEWTCQVCTLVNGRTRAHCAACETTRGQIALGA